MNEGDTLTLEVEIYAVPEPKIVWYKNGQEVRADARIKIQRDLQRLETYNLTLNLVKREDAGEYEVKATNNLGSASTKSFVTVLSEYRGYSGDGGRGRGLGGGCGLGLGNFLRELSSAFRSRSFAKTKSVL